MKRGKSIFEMSMSIPNAHHLIMYSEHLRDLFPCVIELECFYQMCLKFDSEDNWMDAWDHNFYEDSRVIDMYIENKEMIGDILDEIEKDNTVGVLKTIYYPYESSTIFRYETTNDDFAAFMKTKFG